MSKNNKAYARRASLWLPTVGIALATPFLAWFAMGDMSTGDFYEFGPYDVGPSSGYFVGGVATVVALVSVGVLVVRIRQGVVNWWWRGVLVTLAGAGSVGAFVWRAATAGVIGANFGAGFAVFLGPPLIAGLLVAAVWLAYISQQVEARSRSGAGRNNALRRTWLLTVAAVLVAPALFFALFSLPVNMPGSTTARQYGDVRIGETQSAVEENLGREPFGTSSYYFPPAPAGLDCEYYIEANQEHQYRLCFRAGVLVTKDVSSQPNGN